MAWLASLWLMSSVIAQDSTYQVRVMHYNLLNFGINTDNCSFDTQRYQELRTILGHYRPHLFTVNEIGLSTLYPLGILNESFDYPNDMVRTTPTNQAGGDRINHLFYDESLFGLVQQFVLPTSNLRDINAYELYFKPSAPSGDTTFLTCLVAHLKAGDNTSDVNDRAQAAADLMAWVQANGQNRNLLFMGDLNVGNSSELAFQRLVNPTDTDIAWRDPINSLNGWNGASFAGLHTQSTRSSGNGCFSGGGMDDRFDFILTSSSIIDGTLGATYTADTYKALGNAGNSFNGELICGSTNPTVPTDVCLALRNMSDHLPVVMELSIEGQILTTLTEWTKALSVGPNPVQDVLTLTQTYALPSGMPMYVQVRDALGREVLHRLWSEGHVHLQLDTHSWPAGVYHLQVSDGKQVRTHRKLLKLEK